MSDPSHLVIAYAGSQAPGCLHALSDLALPHLNRLLARLTTDPTHAVKGEDTSLSLPHELAGARAMGWPLHDGLVPLAAWQAAQTPSLHSLPEQGWAYLTPCQWQVTTDHITLRDPAALGLTEADSRALLAIVSPWFAEDGITLHYDQPTRWLAEGALFADLATASLDRVLLRDVRAWMPDAKQARTLHRLHSEMQMLLYTHAYNDARAERGQPPVNAFWVHGTGRLPTSSRTPSPMPQQTTALRDAALHEDWRSWAAAWQALDAGPLAELLRTAESGAAVRLTLCGDRNALSLHNSAPRGLFQRIQSLLRPVSANSLLEKL